MWKNLDSTISDCVHRVLRKPFHFDEPLVRQIRLDWRFTAVAMGEINVAIFDFDQEPLVFEIGDDLFEKHLVLTGTLVSEASVQTDIKGSATVTDNTVRDNLADDGAGIFNAPDGNATTVKPSSFGAV